MCINLFIGSLCPSLVPGWLWCWMFSSARALPPWGPGGGVNGVRLPRLLALPLCCTTPLPPTDFGIRKKLSSASTVWEEQKNSLLGRVGRWVRGQTGIGNLGQDSESSGFGNRAWIRKLMVCIRKLAEDFWCRPREGLGLRFGRLAAGGFSVSVAGRASGQD